MNYVTLLLSQPIQKPIDVALADPDKRRFQCTVHMQNTKFQQQAFANITFKTTSLLPIGHKQLSARYSTGN